MYERDHHRRIASVLLSLDADLLQSHACYFGGGTAIALRYGEYRESADIDFLVSDRAGYRALRELLAGPDRLRPLFRTDAGLQQIREVRADQYGIRTLVDAGGRAIKFEIVQEGRITFATPTAADRVCGVSALSPLDMATSELLANTDRWRDDSIMSRGLIDLAMMAPARSMLRQAMVKAREAYGASIDSALGKAIDYLRQFPQRLDQRMAAMSMTTVPRAQLWQRIKALEAVVAPHPRA
ncbi:nucleotidyl transferase AbiEii/AbiGii toxin family protein [Xylophilus sp. GOD-11R]|uniref:nucleotidyl transferase AbiEii/AbiGii toxin family protein n=1 Tax=Xylophilus sp. GOD-11R TaxID=3089814 RepID=UPI00298C813B|nr:nucleotidyl transferase AbiEii/AbiGii toxin family protein [Xylophilus sp. GOD-11R]WPB58498.1 nucleotidyl transferase AbiEii/AbiGii toxin family protein [Xylophilus sp. GOD-11R]